MMIHPHDPSLASGVTVSGSQASDEAGTIDSSYRLLMIRGLSSVEAGNVVAYITGLHAAEQGWTLHEIKHLVALRALVADGIVDPSGRAN
jgi:hypothetical protein